MVILRISVVYQCERCHGDYMLNFNPTSPDIEDAMVAIDKSKQCTVCGGLMSIKSATLRTLKDLCGNDMSGEWKCPVHNTHTYYPIPLRRTLEKKLPSYTGLDKYLNIVNKGYPWRCPHCGCLMQYEEPKDNWGSS